MRSSPAAGKHGARTSRAHSEKSPRRSRRDRFFQTISADGGRARPRFPRKFCSKAFPSFTRVVYNLGVKNGAWKMAKSARFGRRFISAQLIWRMFLKLAAEVAKLARGAVLVRVPHPQDSRAFLYPLVGWRLANTNPRAFSCSSSFRTRG